MLRSLVLIPVLTIGLVIPAIAQQKAYLPMSGSFRLHTGWKLVGDTTKITNKLSYGSGGIWGVAYNDAGSGPLHMGAVVCTDAYEVIEGVSASQGKCAWSDADGDRLFTDWSGKGASTSTGDFVGMNTITGGTGKFKRHSGQGSVPVQGTQLSCMQQFEYEITLERSGTTTPPSTTQSK
jgi:hypothetical protein